METIAPPVVAVIVTCDPGEWFEQTLEAFAAQRYPELSVLVLDAGSEVDPTPRVAAVLPGAYVARVARNRGFGATANEALSMVEGASMLLFCHDDIAPDPDVVHIMVEESFRSNAGVVAPKLVDWSDPNKLLHVGMAVDKGGAVVDRVEVGEIDHGQHDAVRDVFLAPGGCTLVRADLFKELNGFDPGIFAMGEDLDLCWRAQILGARVVVAPGARVRHLEMLASGRRRLPEGVCSGTPAETVEATAPGPAAALERVAAPGEGGPASLPAGEAPNGATGGTEAVRPSSVLVGAGGGAPAGPCPESGVASVTLQSLQRRHELRAALKAYGPFHRVRVVPQIALLAAAEVIVALLAGHRDRASAVAHAWRWNLSNRRALRAARADVRAHRRLDDATVRRLQLRGSARLSAYARRAVAQGLAAANLGAGDGTADRRAPGAGQRRISLLGHAPDPDGDGPRPSTRLVVILVVALVVVFGSRQLIGPGFPSVGQLLPLPGWSTLLHRFVSGWQPTGVGTTDPTTPATGVLGLAGLLLFGSVGLLQKVLVLGCIPLGALGMARLARPLGTTWARITSTVIYLAVPIPYDALASAHWDALVVYAVCPWVLHLLGRASAVAPHPAGPGRPATPTAPPATTWRHRGRLAAAGGGAGSDDAGAGRASSGRAPWRTSLVGQALALGVIDAAATSVAPPVALVTVVVAAGVALGHVVVAGRGGFGPARRVGAVAAGATVVSIVLLAPWSIAVLGSPGRWGTFAGLPQVSSSGVGWGQLLRLAVGPIGDAALAWAFLAAAALPLVIGARFRLAWAGRAWSVALLAWLLAWLAGRGWLGPLDLSPQVLVVPAGVGIALAVGLGVAAFQRDLPGYRFGWRQAAAVTAAAAAAVGMLPVLGASLNGRWDLISTGYGEATSWMAADHASGDFRVLWLGDPRVLPGSGWELSPGLAYSLSENGLPDGTALWPGGDPGRASTIARDVSLARRGGTVRLGQLLAPFAVRYVVVVDTLGPSIPGLQTPPADPPPSDLLPSLTAQMDLRQVISQGGFDVFEDAAALPLRAVRPSAPPPTAAPSPTGSAPGLVGWRPVLPGPVGTGSVTGRVPAGTVLAAVAPASAWQLTTGNGRRASAATAFGYAPTFQVRSPGTVTVGFVGSWLHALEIGLELALWVVVAAALAGRRRWLDWWWPTVRRRLRRRPGEADPDDAAAVTGAPGVGPDGAGDGPTVSSGAGFDLPEPARGHPHRPTRPVPSSGGNGSPAPTVSMSPPSDRPRTGPATTRPGR